MSDEKLEELAFTDKKEEKEEKDDDLEENKSHAEEEKEEDDNLGDSKETPKGSHGYYKGENQILGGADPIKEDEEQEELSEEDSKKKEEDIKEEEDLKKEEDLEQDEDEKASKKGNKKFSLLDVFKNRKEKNLKIKNIRNKLKENYVNDFMEKYIGKPSALQRFIASRPALHKLIDKIAPSFMKGQVLLPGPDETITYEDVEEVKEEDIEELGEIKEKVLEEKEAAKESDSKEESSSVVGFGKESDETIYDNTPGKKEENVEPKTQKDRMKGFKARLKGKASKEKLFDPSKLDAAAQHAINGGSKSAPASKGEAAPSKGGDAR